MPLPDSFLPWLTQYGGFALFALLALGIFGLPIPDETIMVLAGYLIMKGQLNATVTIVSCLLGSLSGITLSYALGRVAGSYIAKKIGHWIGLTDERLARVKAWFERIGKWTLTFGYFVPGLRHFTGYVAGASQLDYRLFGLYAYSGAAIWVATFLSLGYFFGEKAEEAIGMLDTDILIGLLAIGGILFLLAYIRKRWLARAAKK
jgi:membrane protein DedA with SNARE-associated domain